MIKESTELRFFRLVTGEDIIAQTQINKLESGNVYILIDPLKVGYMIQEYGKVGISLYQWIFPKITEDQKFPVFPSDILTTAKPSARMTKYYWETLAKHPTYLEGSVDDDDDEEYTMNDEGEDDMDMTEEDHKSVMDELERIKRKYH